MPSKSNVLGSLVYEGFQTIYAEIMVARGYLAVMLDGENVSGPSNFARKLMDLNHEMDRLLLESEHFLSELQGAAEVPESRYVGFGWAHAASNADPFGIGAFSLRAADTEES